MNKKTRQFALFSIFFAMVTSVMIGQAEAQYTLRTGSALQLSNGCELVAKQILDN